MALVFCDSGGDHYASADITEKFGGRTDAGTGTWTVVAAGRTANCLRFTGASSGSSEGLTRSTGSSATGGVFGAAYKINLSHMLTSFGSGLVELGGYIGNAPDILVALTQAGLIRVFRATANYNLTELCSGASGVVSGQWFYFELKFTFHNTTGSVEARVNGTTVCSATNVDTINGGGTLATFGLLSAMSTGYAATPTIDIDDIYLLDNNAPNNDFLGDVTVKYCAASGAGSTTQWDPSTGSNYDCVNDTEPNDDTDYVSTAVVDEIDTYATADAPSGATILATQIVVAAKKGDAGTSTITGVTRHSSTNYAHASPKGIADSTAYRFLTFPQDVNPGTSAAWVETDFNNAEFGIKKTA